MHQQSEAPQVTNIFSSRDNLFGKIDQSCLLNVKTVVYRRSFAVVNGGYFRLLIFLASADTFITDSAVTSRPKLVFVYVIKSGAGRSA